MTLYLMEPELEELLHTIARDPRSTLLRVDRPTILRSLFDRDPMVRESCTQLTSAERQLLRVHRSELAWHLRLSCFDLLNTQSYSELSYCMDFGSDPFPPQPGADQSIKDALELSSRDRSPVRRLAIEDAISTRDPLKLASVACRLIPSTASYLLLSDAFQVLGDSERDLLSIKKANHLATSAHDRAHVQSYLGFHRAIHGELGPSMDCYRSAYRLGNSWPNEVLSCLLLAARCTDRDRFEEAAAEIANTPVSETTLAEWTDSQRVRLGRGRWSVSREAMSFVAGRKNIHSEQVLYVLDQLFAVSR